MFQIIEKQHEISLPFFFSYNSPLIIVPEGKKFLSDKAATPPLIVH